MRTIFPPSDPAFRLSNPIDCHKNGEHDDFPDNAMCPICTEAPFYAQVVFTLETQDGEWAGEDVYTYVADTPGEIETDIDDDAGPNGTYDREGLIVGDINYLHRNYTEGDIW